ncbi:hypothetical protein F5Y12DRAFT_636638 [Xylaria sp. FL1777]|nr:hypothetical protein F5Y12DRAFT_636638 [Xylaria sp. FL1777]
MASRAPPYHFLSNSSEPSLKAPTLPPYTEHAGATPADEDIELADLSPSTSTSSLHASTTAAGSSSSSSSSSTANPIFTPTKQLQIQTQGKDLIAFPTPTRPGPIPIFTLTPTGHLDRPLYLSVRPQYRSGSCFLTYGDDETQTPLTTTTYRFGYGPGRRPVITLGDPTQNPAMEDNNNNNNNNNATAFELVGRSLFSRATHFRVPGLASFGWRYANASERAAAAAGGADSLLVCEVFGDDGFDAGYGKDAKKKEKAKVKAARRVAQLVRNETFRSPGSSRSSAGNGGRLMLDLAPFEEKLRERVEWLVVTTAVAMLKREVDRRRAQQIAAISAIGS